MRNAVAERDNLHSEIAVILAEDSSSMVRQSLAENHNLAPKILLKLAKDVDEKVVCKLLEHHPNLIDLDSDILFKLAKDKSEKVRNKIASYQKLSPEIVEVLAFDASLKVRQSLVCDRSYIQNFQLPIGILWTMLRDIKELLSEPSLLKKHVIVYGKNLFYENYTPLSEKAITIYIKIALAKHDEINEEYLKSLLQDDCPEVRAAAVSNLKLSAATLEQLLDEENSREVIFSPQKSQYRNYNFGTFLKFRFPSLRQYLGI